jgi:murein DD-endopeptidase MepM/ murein hydrolase activator NlpD
MRSLIFYIFLLISSSHFAYSQDVLAIENPEELTANSDRWEAEITPLTYPIDILNKIYGDAFRYELIHNVPAGYPLNKTIDITSLYGTRKHPVHGDIRFHKGIDLKGQTGELAIATGDGIIIETGEKPDLGKYVKIKHKYGFETIYGHLSAIKVKKGTFICKNQIVGLVGATGKVTGPHLHYTMKKNGEYIDPFEFIFMDFKDESK